VDNRSQHKRAATGVDLADFDGDTGSELEVKHKELASKATE
jgi:hypothetical protein